MKGLYLSPRASAITLIIPLILLLSLLTACGSKPTVQFSYPSTGKPQSVQAIAPHQNSQAIMGILNIAREDGDIDQALSELEQLERESASPLKEEAGFRRVELLLENQYPNALSEAHKMLTQHPQHVLAAYTHFWLASWWKSQGIALGIESDSNLEYSNHIVHELTLTLKHPRLTQALAQQALAMGRSEVINVAAESTIPWYLAASHIDPKQQAYWLRAAASNLSLEALRSLHQQQTISPSQDEPLYLHFAQLQLMSGNIGALQSLANMLSVDAPYLALTRTIKAWASGDMKDVHIGVLLPLSGSYSRYGKEALDGIRMAMSEQGESNHVHLYIEDTGAGIEAAITGYKNLNQHNVDWIIGPLLSKHTEALLPYLKNNIPVISLSKKNSLAEASPSLFIHNTARNTQAEFMAQHAFSQGLRRMAVIYGDHTSEAEVFSATFERLGGEPTRLITLDSSGIDHRNTLKKLREDSDDGALLAELLSDIALLSPETELEVHMPLNIDGLYLALSGKQVSELAGQLAYVDIRGIPMLGSNRWMDGHLLDDRGRNLATARFIRNKDNRNTSSLRTQFREIWGQEKLGKLFTVSYDSARIATLLGSRLGLHGKDAIRAMQDSNGFPGESGHVYFDQYGVGHKQFHIWRVSKGHLVPTS